MGWTYAITVLVLLQAGLTLWCWWEWDRCIDLLYRINEEVNEYWDKWKKAEGHCKTMAQRIRELEEDNGQFQKDLEKVEKERDYYKAIASWVPPSPFKFKTYLLTILNTPNPSDHLALNFFNDFKTWSEAPAPTALLTIKIPLKRLSIPVLTPAGLARWNAIIIVHPETQIVLGGHSETKPFDQLIQKTLNEQRPILLEDLQRMLYSELSTWFKNAHSPN